jgi:hypothetical protein
VAFASGSIEKSVTCWKMSTAVENEAVMMTSRSFCVR